MIRNATTPLLALAALLVSSAPLPAQTPSPVVEKLVERVSLTRMHADVATLVDAGGHGTRNRVHAGGFWAQDWLYDTLLALGYTDIYLHDYDQIVVQHDNVVATLPGLVDPDEIYVLGAHYDSVGQGLDPGVPAPGADDNGSGTAALLEIARIVSESGVRFEATILFVAFGSEEQGTIGSNWFVDDAVAAGEDIRGAVVMDVMGWYESGPLNVAIGIPELPSHPPELLALQALAAWCVETYLPGVLYETGETCT